MISGYFKVSHDDVLRKRTEYSAVAKAYQGFSANVRRDKALRKKVEDIRANLS